MKFSVMGEARSKLNNDIISPGLITTHSDQWYASLTDVKKQVSTHCYKLNRSSLMIKSKLTRNNNEFLSEYIDPFLFRPVLYTNWSSSV